MDFYLLLQLLCDLRDCYLCDAPSIRDLINGTSYRQASYPLNISHPFLCFFPLQHKTDVPDWHCNFPVPTIQSDIYQKIFFTHFSTEWSLATKTWALGVKKISIFSSVQFSRSVMSDYLQPGLPVHHQLPEFTQTHIHRVSDAIQPSHPLSSPSPPAPNPSHHQSLFQWVNPSHEVAKVLELQL